MQRASFSFLNEAHLQHVVDRLCARNNASLPSGKNPVTTFALPDNSTVIILFPPVTPNSPSVSIRRVVRKPITIEQLVKWGSVSADMLQFLKASVEARINILVCGYQGSGADTIVNVLSSFVPGDERVISIEYENNYSLRINHLIKLIAQNDLMDENSFIKLLALTGKLRGDRLFLGEFLFSDAYDALTNVSDNFSGSILRVVAKSPADAINRLETFIQLDKPNLPRTKIGNLICSSIDLIVYQERLSDGTRVIKKIVEVLDETNRDGQVLLRELYGVERAGFQDDKILRTFKSYGPPSDRLMEKINTAGINLPSSIFVPGEDTKHDTKLTETERRAIRFSKGKYAFVSYSREDRDRVRALASELENKGFDVWLDVFNINPGEEWTKVLENAIKNAGAFLVILTPSAAQSQFVRNEIIMAQDEKLPIIPVKMDECDTPIQIRALQYILYDKHDMTATVNLISESLSRYISNKQLLGNM
jgi:Flp pilus assembly CpaF family ATPase